jgi:hypothetical protein
MFRVDEDVVIDATLQVLCYVCLALDYEFDVLLSYQLLSKGRGGAVCESLL